MLIVQELLNLSRYHPIFKKKGSREKMINEVIARRNQKGNEVRKEKKSTCFPSKLEKQEEKNRETQLGSQQKQLERQTNLNTN